MSHEYDLVIIGAGPAGYVAGIRAGQLGMKTAIVDRKYIGGMCLNWGCIPTKGLLESAKFYRKLKDAKRFGIEGIDLKATSINWAGAVKNAGITVKKLTRGVEYLLKKNKVELIRAEAKITGPNQVTADDRLLETKQIIIATGSVPANLPFELPQERLIQLESMLEIETIPQSLVVYGTGPVALELAQMFSMMDHDVTILCPDETLLPGLDRALVDFVTKRLKKEKIGLVTGVKKIAATDDGFDADGTKIEAGALLNASWRKAVVPESSVKLPLTESGYIETGEFFRVEPEGSIYAVGDVNGKSYLAHAASAEAICAVNHMQGVQQPVDFERIPINIYAAPEIAQIGLTAEELTQRGIEFKTGQFSLSANGKALAEHASEGFVRVLSETKYGEVMGVQIVADNATDLISEAAAFMQIEATIWDVARTVHAHPTVSEVFLEAGLDAAGEPLHQ